MTWKKKRPDAVPGIDGISKQRPIFQLDRHLAQGNDGFCRIKQFLDLKMVDFIEVNLPKFA